MAFIFPLATVLRLREIAEEREERLLGQILQQISHLIQIRADLEQHRVKVVRNREASLHTKMSAAELHIFYQEMCSVDEKLKNTNEQLAKLETLRLQQLKAYEVAHRSRELLDDMREVQKKLYRREETKLEQKIMDDNFISRRLIR